MSQVVGIKVPGVLWVLGGCVYAGTKGFALPEIRDGISWAAPGCVVCCMRKKVPDSDVRALGLVCCLGTGTRE